MSYSRQLLLRWSRHDRLAVLVIAAAVAFLTGAVLLVVAGGTQTASIAAQFESPGSTAIEELESVSKKQTEAVVLPITTATADGETVTVIGVPAEYEREFARGGSLQGAPPPTLGTLKDSQRQTLVGDAGTTALSVKPRTGSILPAQWYVVSPRQARQLGASHALLLYPGLDGEVPLLAALSFFVIGTREALAALSLVALSGGVLVAITIFSVTRMTIRDRLTTIRVIRATGASPARVLGLFCLRAGLLTGAGVALGYAVGVIISSGVVNLAITAGLPTTLAVRVSGEVARQLLPAFGTLLGIGIVAGAVATWPAVRVLPAEINQQSGSQSSRLPDALAPSLLDWRALVPTAATLTVFVALVLLVAGLAGIAGSLSGSGGAVITEPDASHPIESQVPTAYAEALEARQIDASAEILLLEVQGENAFIARGANYSAFASLSGARLLAGEAPNAPDEVVVGDDLAPQLGLDIGDKLLLGGSTAPGIARPTVVGIYEAPGLADDQVVVPLETARQLSTVGPGMVNFVRAETLPEVTGGSMIGVIGLEAPDRIVSGRPLSVTVTVRNDGMSEAESTIEIQYCGEHVARTVTLAPGQTTELSVEFDSGPPGTHALRAGTVRQSVRVLEPNESRSLSITLVSRAPPGSEPLVTVTNASGQPVSNAVVSAAGQMTQTNAAGETRIRLPETAGTVNVTVEHENATATTTVRVDKNAARTLRGNVVIEPSSPSLTTRPIARVELRNGWNRSLTRAIELSGPETQFETRATVAPGERTRFTVRLARQPPGEHGVTLSANGTQLATTTYTVTGDDRLVSSLASGGYTGSSGLSQAIEAAFGNLRLVIVALLMLAGLMTVGGTAATFAAAVHARRQTIGIRRAVGATQGQMLWLLLADALRIGLPATAIAVLAGYGLITGLSSAGYLTAFGVTVTPPVSLRLFGFAAFGAVGVTVLGAGFAAGALLRTPPAQLLAEQNSRQPSGGHDD